MCVRQLHSAKYLGRSLQCARRRIESSSEIIDFASSDRCIAGSDRFSHRWKHHRRIAVILVGGVDEVPEPRSRDETFGSCKLAFNFDESRICALQRRK